MIWINGDEKFEYIYSNLNNEDVQQIEGIRKEIKRRKIIKHLAFIVALISLVCFYTKIIEELKVTIDLGKFRKYNDMLELSSLCIRFLIPLWLLSGIYKSKKKKQYEKQYKNTILSNFVNLYDKNLGYKSKFNEEFCRELRREYLDNNFSIDATNIKWADRVNIQNNIFGKLENNTVMNLYDISLEKINNHRKSTLGDSFMRSIFKEGYTTSNIFRGTYITLDISKQLPTYIRISKNRLIQRNDTVELDSAEFEKYFDVNSDDKILATRILTADVMQILVDFYKKYNIIFEIVFKGNKICINLHTGQAFKIPIYTGINKQQMYIYYAILEFTTNLSKEINNALNGIEL